MSVSWIDKHTKIKHMEITDEFVMVDADMPMTRVARKMLDLGDHGSALVTRGDDRVIGFLSRKGFLELAAKGFDPRRTRAHELMNEDFMEISGEETVEKVIPFIADKYPEAIVVIDFDGNCMGYFSRNDYRDALAGLGCYDQTHEPITPEEWLTKGIAISSLGKVQEAIECYENYVKIQPDVQKGWFMLARKFEKEGRFKDAVICYDMYLKLNPNDADGWFNRGNVLNRMRNYLQAAQSYSHALKILPDNKSILMNLGLTLTDAGKSKKALEVYSKLESIIGESADLSYKKGNIYDKDGKHKESIKCYSRATELNPNHEESWFNMGAALHSQGKERKAMKCFDEVLRIDPNNVSAREARTICEENKRFLFF